MVFVHENWNVKSNWVRQFSNSKIFIIKNLMEDEMPKT